MKQNTVKMMEDKLASVKAFRAQVLVMKQEAVNLRVKDAEEILKDLLVNVDEVHTIWCNRLHNATEGLKQKPKRVQKNSINIGNVIVRANENRVSVSAEFEKDGAATIAVSDMTRDKTIFVRKIDGRKLWVYDGAHVAAKKADAVASAVNIIMLTR